MSVTPVPHPEHNRLTTNANAAALAKNLICIQTPEPVQDFSRRTRHKEARCTNGHAQYSNGKSELPYQRSRRSLAHVELPLPNRGINFGFLLCSASQRHIRTQKSRAHCIPRSGPSLQFRSAVFGQQLSLFVQSAQSWAAPVLSRFPLGFSHRQDALAATRASKSAARLMPFAAFSDSTCSAANR